MVFAFAGDSTITSDFATCAPRLLDDVARNASLSAVGHRTVARSLFP